MAGGREQCGPDLLDALINEAARHHEVALVRHDERATARAAHGADECALEERRVDLYDVVASDEPVRGMRERRRNQPAAETPDGWQAHHVDAVQHFPPGQVGEMLRRQDGDLVAARSQALGDALGDRGEPRPVRLVEREDGEDPHLNMSSGDFTLSA